MEILNQFNNFDYAVMIVTLILVAYGIIRGLSEELTGLVVFLAAFIGGWKVYPIISSFLVKKTMLEDNFISEVIAYILGFFIIGLVAKLLMALVTRAMQFAFTGKTERLGGGLSGLIKAIVLTSIVILASAHFSILNSLIVEESVIGRFGHKHLPAISQKIQGFFSKDESSEGDGKIETSEKPTRGKK